MSINKLYLTTAGVFLHYITASAQIADTTQATPHSCLHVIELKEALWNINIDTISTDHAEHEQKQLQREQSINKEWKQTFSYGPLKESGWEKTIMIDILPGGYVRAYAKLAIIGRKWTVKHKTMMLGNKRYLTVSDSTIIAQFIYVLHSKWYQQYAHKIYSEYFWPNPIQTYEALLEEQKKKFIVKH